MANFSAGEASPAIISYFTAFLIFPVNSPAAATGAPCKTAAPATAAPASCTKDRRLIGSNILVPPVQKTWPLEHSKGIRRLWRMPGTGSTDRDRVDIPG